MFHKIKCFCHSNVLRLSRGSNGSHVLRLRLWWTLQDSLGEIDQHELAALGFY